MSANMINVTDDTFNKVSGQGLVVVDFYAEWCGPCKTLLPALEKVSADRGLTVLKVNIDEVESVTKQFGVRNIPTLVVLQDGKEVGRKTGSVSVKVLNDWIDAIEPKAVKTEATELEYLKYFFRTADFGPAHGDVIQIINEQFEKETGKEVPVSYRYE